jgi:predicted nucleic-acid-binding Zn-ribbon protein
MRHTRICPKCESDDILKIKGGSTWTGYQNFILGSLTKMVPVTRYLCANCGFSEEWVEDQKGLELLKKKHGGDHLGNQFV